MTINKALKLVAELYNQVKENPYIKNPVAWALYQTWKEADQEQNNG